MLLIFLYVGLIFIISFTACEIIFTVHNYKKIKKSDQKYIRLRKKKAEKSTKIWIVLSLCNFLMHAYNIAEVYWDDNIIVDNSRLFLDIFVSLAWLATLILYLIKLFLSVWISDKNIVYGDNMISSDIASYKLNYNDGDTMLYIYGQNYKYPLVELPYIDNDEKYTDAMDILKNNYQNYKLLKKTKVKKDKKHLITVIICMIILFASSGIFYCIRKPFVMIGDIPVWTDTKELHFSILRNIDQRHVQETTKLKSDDLKTLKYLPDLEVLNVYDNSITDLTYIGQLENLRELYIGGGEEAKKPDDYSPLGDLKKLEKFVMFGAEKFNGYEYLQRLPKLKSIKFTDKVLSSDDIKNISKISSLAFLDISRCTIDGDNMSELKNLKKLCINGIKTDSLDFLKELDNIEYLELTGVDIQSSVPLENMDSLKDIYVSESRIPQDLKEKLESKGVTVHMCW